MEIQQKRLQIQQNHELEASHSEQDGQVAYTKPRATTLQLYPALLEAYPAIGETKFYNSELPKDHDIFNWDDFHYTAGMVYKPPPVLQHSEVSLTGAAKKHELDLATIQGYLADRTRFYDTFAHELLNSEELDREHTFSFLNTVRISLSHDASRISRMRENIYLDELGIKHGDDKDDPLFTLDELASRKANADLIRKTYKK
ncbi:hypothetical protein BG004_004560 [Podila humilis]|nr:hypothetical protein BG004_004560 [Podila humilis]